jgi:hypothetical protein
VNAALRARTRILSNAWCAAVLNAFNVPPSLLEG